jgi:glyoxylase-like metal-dependent hydrolase (beta-lactamase superfamily II)
MFTGDTLFVRGYGRTDFMYGSDMDLDKSLGRLSRMDGDITFYPGHGGKGLLKNEHIY